MDQLPSYFFAFGIFRCNWILHFSIFHLHRQMKGVSFAVNLHNTKLVRLPLGNLSRLAFRAVYGFYQRKCGSTWKTAERITLSRHGGKPRILFVHFFRFQNFLKLKLLFRVVYFVPFFGHWIWLSRTRLTFLTNV